MQPDLSSAEVLFALVCEGTASDEQLTRLTALLRENEEIRDRYLEYMTLHADLASDYSLFGGSPIAAPQPDKSTIPGRESAPGNSRWRQIRTAIHPHRHPLVFALTVAALTLFYWTGIHATFFRSWNQPANGLPNQLIVPREAARIANLHQVQWSSGQLPQYAGARISAGSTLRFSKGLIELVFDSGVRIVVEGPADLQVESRSSALMKEGRLMAFVPQEGRGFMLRLPGAQLIDLGTEFGLIAKKSGQTDLVVFQGRVEVLPLPKTNAQWHKRTLQAGDFLRFDQRNILASGTPLPELQTLVRALPSDELSLDIADIVAGGSGRGRASDLGIQLHNGTQAISFHQDYVTTSGAFKSMARRQIIDGVFVIRSDGKPQQINESGELSFAFPKCDGRSWGQLWAWEPRMNSADSQTWIHPLVNDPGRLIAMHSNAGLTIDLDQLRQSYPAHRLQRLLGYAGNEYIPKRGGKGNTAAAWVLVDGDARLKQTLLRSGAAPVPIDILIGDQDRYLTLAVTDGGDGMPCDFVIWKHLRLRLVANNPEAAPGSIGNK